MSQEKAGTAAVAAAAPSAPTPPILPDAAEYRRFKAAFSTELKRVGVKRAALQDLLQSVEDLWAICSSMQYTLTGLISSSYTICKKFEGQQAHSLVNLFVQRTVITAGVHQQVLGFVLGQETVTTDACYCFMLLSDMLNPENYSTEKTPAACLPGPEQSYEALAPLHWQPRTINLACRVLLSEDLTEALQATASKYLLFLINPSKRAMATVRARADMNAVLSDGPCMSAIWELLQSPKHYCRTALLLQTLVCNARKDSSTSSSRTGMAFLLDIGAANAITAALNLHAQKLMEVKVIPEQAQRGEHLKGVCCFGCAPGREEEHQWRLEAMVSLSATLAQVFDVHAEWPDTLKQAHLCALLKVMAEDHVGDIQQGVVDRPLSLHLTLCYTHPSMLTKAAALLATDSKESLGQLFLCLASTTYLFTDGLAGCAWEGEAVDTFDAYSPFLQFLLALLSNDEASKQLQSRMPFVELSKSTGFLFVALFSEKAANDSSLLQKTSFLQLLKVAAQLCLFCGAEDAQIPPPIPELLRAIEQLAKEPTLSAAAQAHDVLKRLEAEDDNDEDDSSADDESEDAADGTAARGGVSACERGGLLGAAHRASAGEGVSCAESSTQPGVGVGVVGGGVGGCVQRAAGSSTGLSNSGSCKKGSSNESTGPSPSTAGSAAEPWHSSGKEWCCQARGTHADVHRLWTGGPRTKMLQSLHGGLLLQRSMPKICLANPPPELWAERSAPFPVVAVPFIASFLTTSCSGV